MTTSNGRPVIFGPLLIVAGVVAAVIFAFLLHPSAGPVQCGGKSAWSISTESRGDVKFAAERAAGGGLAGSVADRAVDSCFGAAHRDLWFAGASLFGGVLLGLFIARQENR
jgi:hypothetical protein